MNNNPKVCVLLPTYKRAKIIHRAINSILNQSYNNFKLIVVDDNSPDDTEQIVRNYNDERIKYVKNTLNIGHPINFAKCMQLAEGYEFFIIFGDDDEMMPDALKMLVTFLMKNQNIPFVHGIEIQVHEDGAETKDKPFFPETRIVNTSIYLESYLRLNGEYGISLSSVLFRTEFIKYNDIKVIHDHYWDFNFFSSCILFSDKLGYLNEFITKRYAEEMYHERKIAPILYRAERLYLAQKFINKNEFYLLARKYPISKYRYVLSKKILKQAVKVKKFNESFLCINTALKNILNILIPMAIYFLLLPLKWVLRLKRINQS